MSGTARPAVALPTTVGAGAAAGSGGRAGTSAAGATGALPAAELLRAARVAEQAAYAAGTHLQTSRSRLAAVMVTQEDPDVVAQAIASEALHLVHEVVGRSFPDHGFVAPDCSFAHIMSLRDQHPVWVVDPIDGRANYQRGFPHYAVSIALVVDGDPLVGVVYDPVRNEFFGAIQGKGAVMNGERIECAWPREPADGLAATVFPRPGHPRMAQYLGEFARMTRGFGGVRRAGAMALELAYLAAGRVDAFWAHDTPPWAVAAALLLLRESGAHMEARDDRPLLLSRSLLACVPGMRAPLLRLLQPG